MPPPEDQPSVSSLYCDESMPDLDEDDIVPMVQRYLPPEAPYIHPLTRYQPPLPVIPEEQDPPSDSEEELLTIWAAGMERQHGGQLPTDAAGDLRFQLTRLLTRHRPAFGVQWETYRGQLVCLIST